MSYFRSNVSGRQLWLIPAAVLVMLMMQGCDKTSAPTSDSTPPTLKWTVIRPDTPNQTINGSGNITAQPGDSFDVTLTAEDPQGIHEISLAATTSWTCSAGDVAQTSGPSLGSPTVQTLSPDSEGNVLTSIFLIEDVNFGPFNCPAGYTLIGATITLLGTGENYFSGVTNGSLVIAMP